MAAVPKGQEAKMLPPGTVMEMESGADGRWSGRLTAENLLVTAGDAAGMPALLAKLARRWLRARGVRTEGKP